MTKDVIVSIKGLQYAPEDSDDSRVETENRGTYYDKGLYRYLSYEESPDGEETVTSFVKFREGYFELNRKGKYSTRLVFEEGKKNYTNYKTPFGDFVLGIDSDSVILKETDSKINVTISYDLEMNYEHLAHCKIELSVHST